MNNQSPKIKPGKTTFFSTNHISFFVYRRRATGVVQHGVNFFGTGVVQQGVSLVQNGGQFGSEYTKIKAQNNCKVNEISPDEFLSLKEAYEFINFLGNCSLFVKSVCLELIVKI
jgi:hypothetical protein